MRYLADAVRLVLFCTALIVLGLFAIVWVACGAIGYDADSDAAD